MTSVAWYNDSNVYNKKQGHLSFTMVTIMSNCSDEEAEDLYIGDQI